MKNDNFTEIEQFVLDLWDSDDDPADCILSIKGALYHPPEKGGIRKLFRTQDPP